jgi:hypothetical protein
MIVQAERRTPEFTDPNLTPGLQTVLAQLATARDHAVRTHADAWDFAVELGGLLTAGVMTADLRWLSGQGYVDFATEITSRGDLVRSFHAVRWLAFTARTCFVLTDEGARWAGAGAAREARGLPADSPRCLCLRLVGEGNAGESDLPRWDAAEQVLRLAGRVVKRYRYSSQNQQDVLAAFEEERWPWRIDDPLRPVRGSNQKQRLRDTIRALNAKQENCLLRFRAAGRGEQVIWEPLAMHLTLPIRTDLRRAA